MSFISDITPNIGDFGDVNVLLGLVNETKTAYGNTSLANTALLYAEMAAISLAWKELSIAVMNKSDNKLDAEQEAGQVNSSSDVDDSKTAKSIFDNALVQYQANIKKISDGFDAVSVNAVGMSDVHIQKLIDAIDISKLFSSVGTSVDNYNKIEKPYDTNYTMPRNIDRNVNDDVSTYGYTAPSIYAGSSDNDTSVYKNPSPIFGTPFDNLSDQISETMNNQTSFDTVDGGKMFKGWAVQDSSGNWIPDPIRTFTQKTPFSDIIGKVIAAEFKNQKQPPGTVKFFIEKLHGRYADGTPYKKNPVVSQLAPIDTNNLSNRMVFAAYIENFNDSYSNSWNSYNFIGRGEEVPIYKSTKRTMTLSFSIIADYSLDLLVAMEKVYTEFGWKPIHEDRIQEIIDQKQDWGLGYIGIPSISNGKRYGGHIPGMYSDTTETMWTKLTFLAQCMYPYYRQDGKMKEQPIVRIRLADFYDVIGYIESFQIDLSEFDNMIDLNPSAIGNIPFAAKVTLSLTILHDNEPNSTFYGFYHRKEFDNGTIDPVTGAGVATDPKGLTAQGIKKNSPTSFDASTTREATTDTPVILQDGSATGAFGSAMTDFSSSYSALTTMGTVVSDEERKQKIQKAMMSYIRVTEVADQLRYLYGEAPSQQTNQLPNSVADLAPSSSIANTGTTNDALNTPITTSINNTQSTTGTLDPINSASSNSSKFASGSSVNNDEVANAYNTSVNSSAGNSNAPKTIQDIIDQNNITV